MVTLDATKKRNLKQHNAITGSRYEFSVVEKRIIYLIIEKLNGIENEAIEESELNEGLKLTINYRPILEISELYSENANKNHSYIKDALKRLIFRNYEFDNIMITEPDGTTEPVDESFNIIAQYRIYRHKTTAKILVPKMALKYFRNLSKNFTTYNMFNAMTLQSQYSQRLYEQCSRWKDTTWFIMSLDKLKEILNIPDGYSITMIKKRVLDIAKTELYAKTELSFAYKERKEGKKITGFDFKIFFNESKAARLSAPTPPEAVEELILC